MKELRILRGSKGEVISTSESSPGDLVEIEPEPERAQKVESGEVPSDYLKDLPGLYKKLEKKTTK